MVKRIFILLMGCTLGGQVVEKTKGSCSSEVVMKARTEGLRSLSFSEQIQYTLDLRKCEPKELKKAIEKEVNEKQLDSDAKESGSFIGKTSSFAYCVMALLLYWVFV